MRVDADGTETEMLDGTSIKRPGSHTEICVKDWEKIGHWLKMIEWCQKKGWGAKRIAGELNDQNIPSPDAGRTRSENGRRHRVSGQWTASTVRALLRNTAIIGLLRYGVQAEGSHRRSGADGPRVLSDADRRPDGEPKVVNNTDELVIRRPMKGFKPLVDQDVYEECQRVLDERGRHQRGISKTKDPGKYPLSTRVYDLNCGYPMYGRTSGQRRMYTCGRYVNSDGRECDHNQVDAEATLQFVLSLLRQKVTMAGGVGALRERLGELARDSNRPHVDPKQLELQGLKSRLDGLEQELDLVKNNLARAKNNAVFEAVSEQFQLKDAEVKRVRQKVADLQAQVQAPVTVGTIDQEIDRAVDLFQRIEKVASDQGARNEIRPLLQRLNLNVWLKFTGGIKGNKMPVRVLTGGMITTGDAEYPVRPYGGDGDCPGEGSGGGDVSSSPAGENDSPSASLVSRREGESFSKVCRGDKIRTCDLLDPNQAL